MFEKQTISVELETTPFALKLLALRKDAKVSQTELARVIGVGRSTVAMWETGKATPSLRHAVGICRLLNTTPNDLLDFDKSKKSVEPLFTPPRTTCG